VFSARRAEIAALLWADVDLGHGTIRIRRGKGGRARFALLTEEAQAALAAYYVAAGEPADTVPVFPVPAGVGHPRQAGQPYTPGGLYKWVRTILIRAECWTPGRGGVHRFRRTLATEYLRSNPHDLIGLMTLLGHKQVATTQKYVFVNAADLAPRLAAVRL
jgi:integrase/recombinase XerD